MTTSIPADFSEQAPSLRVRLTTQQWVDAYTVHLESIAQAVADARLRATLVDACQEARARAQMTGDPEDHRIFMEQVHVLTRSGVGRFDAERYAETKARWRTVSHHLLSLGFDLYEDIDIERLSTDRWRISQASTRAQWECSTEEMQVLCAFVSFVQHFSQFETPVAYVRRTLERQGITKETWPFHAHRLMIRNPWEGES